jgi:plasmid maintenance system antidote protein VapI
MEMAQVRIPSDRPPTPPGEMLLEEFIKPLGMTQAELADRIGTTPQFWLNGQLALDLYRVSHDEEELRQLERIEPVSS